MIPMNRYLLLLLLLIALPSLYHYGPVRATAPETEADSPGATETEARASLPPYDLTDVSYTQADSARVVQLLGLPHSPTPQQDVLMLACRFLGVPYVGGTLEKGGPGEDSLVVNLHQLDCTTLVETVIALAITRHAGEKDFGSYCRHLESVRYREGRREGYLSRLHYFTWWIHDHMARRQLVETSRSKHSTAPLVVNNYYMSRFPDKYPSLAGRPTRIDSVARLERAENGPDGHYLPQASTLLSRAELSGIDDGDIVAIVTKKAGLDYSHIGFAVWGKDGHLHLLNASSLHHKVVEEPKTLFRYLQEHPSSIGIRTWRWQFAETRSVESHR